MGIYTRGAIGESLAYLFYPIIILAMWNIYTQDVKEKTYKNNALILALGVAGIIYSHILSTEMTVIVLFVIAMVLFKKTIRKETIIVLLKSMIYCAFLSVAFLVPFIEYYTNVDVILGSDDFKSVYIQNKGVYIADLFSFFKDVFGGAGIRPFSRMQLTPGLLLMCGLMMGIYFIIEKKASKQMCAFLGGGIVCLYISSNLFPWNAIYEIPVIGPVLVSVQFPFRYLAIAICFLSILFIFVLKLIVSEEILDYKRAIEYIIAIGMLSVFVFVGSYEKDNESIRTYDLADLRWYTDTSEFGLGANEYLLKDSDVTSTAFDYAVYGDNNIKAAIQSEKGLKMVIWVDANKGDKLEIPRFAYPHMDAFNQNGERLEFYKGNNNKLTVRFDKDYEGRVIVDFVEPWYWRVSEFISLLSILGISGYLCYIKNNKFCSKRG